MFNPDEKVEDAWVRSRERCESHRVTRGRSACGAVLRWERRGGTQEGAWEPYSAGDASLGGWEAVHQCQILCWRCYAEATVEKQTGDTLAAPHTHHITA